MDAISKKDWRITRKKWVITISREFGSGGHSIGKIVAETLGIGFYDQEYWKGLQRKQDFQKNLLKKPQNILQQRTVFFYFAQTKIIKNLAFIYSDMKDREKRILERYGESEKPVQKTDCR